MKFRYLALVLLVSTAVAEDVEDALERSSFAGVVHITSGVSDPYKDSENHGCGTGYEAYARARQVFVNNIDWYEGRVIEFRANLGLELGGEYLVFLNEEIVGPDEAPFWSGDVRTERCMWGGITLVPVLLEMEYGVRDAVFQEWRVFESERGRVEDQYKTYYVMNGFKSTFEPLESIQIEIHPSRGQMTKDAYDRDEVLELVKDRACSLRDPDSKPVNELELAKCPQ